MPRKIDPRLNEQSLSLPSDYTTQYELPPDIQTCFPVDLDAVARKQVLQDIRFALGEYYWEMNAGPDRYTRAEATASLMYFLKEKDFKRTALWSLNQRAYEHLYLAAGDDVQSWMLRFDNQEPPVEGLKAAALEAIADLRQRSGPEVSVPLHFLISRLCHAFADMTGLQVTHSNKGRDLGYRSEPQSSAGRFVTCILSKCYPEIRPSQISGVMKAFVKYRPEPF